ncbi:DUF4349 domain-containing protein [Flavobacterium aquariorum]|uniref:DUF4349 domain-containing protein n=1 Tax=Flavobacterium aquariorum TaxID=2217670 RepID=A0A2W7U715_9FLAO|nr:DUF4349 domain-containing protein [Flavobacterium aquariorum]PZX93039.1 DUF4349 domain-containing protein [Flavobacterium aquariorum]
MNKIVKQGLISLAIITLIISCKKSEASEESTSDIAISADSISSSAAVEKEGSTRKFIRTADLKFKVKNVTQSTYIIENITNKFDGFVTYTNLQSNIIDKFETKISQDSTLETTRYNVENNITIRVPNKRLDTVIKTIAKQIDFLDYRIIKADDVSLKMLSNQLSQKRSSTNQKRVEKAIDTKGKKINDIMEAENNLASQKEQNDNSKLENLSIQDQIDFSTLTIQIYQHESVKQEMIANTKDYNYYKPNIGIRIIDSLKTGWYVLLDVIVFIIEIWWLVFIVISLFFLYKKYLKKK